MAKTLEFDKVNNVQDVIDFFEIPDWVVKDAPHVNPHCVARCQRVALDPFGYVDTSVTESLMPEGKWFKALQKHDGDAMAILFTAAAKEMGFKLHSINVNFLYLIRERIGEYAN